MGDGGGRGGGSGGGSNMVIMGTWWNHGGDET